MADYVGPIRRWQRTDTVPTNAEGGYAGADSVAAQLSSIGDQAYAAQQTIQNLAATATTGAAGSPASATVTGTGTSKVINFVVPQGLPGVDGADGMGYAEGQALVADAQAAADSSAQSAADAQTAMQAQFMTQDEGVAALVDTSAGPKTQSALSANTLGIAQRTDYVHTAQRFSPYRQMELRKVANPYGGTDPTLEVSCIAGDGRHVTYAVSNKLTGAYRIVAGVFEGVTSTTYMPPWGLSGTDEGVHDVRMSTATISGVFTASGTRYTTEVGAYVEGAATFPATGGSLQVSMRAYTDNRGGIWRLSIVGHPEFGTFDVSTWNASAAQRQLPLWTISTVPDGDYKVRATFMGDDPANAPTGGVSRGWTTVNASSDYFIRASVPEPTRDKTTTLKPGFSNPDFAVLIRPAAGGTYRYVPHHDQGESVESQISAPVYYDGSEAIDVDAMAMGDVVALTHGFEVVQRIYGRNVTAGPNLLSVTTKQRISPDGTLSVEGSIKVLADIQVSLGSYVLMHPLNPSAFDRIVSSWGNVYPLTGKADGAMTNVAEKNRATSYAAISATDTGILGAVRYNDVTAALRVSESTLTNPVWIEHRNSALAKLYPRIGYAEDTIVPAGTVWRFSGDYWFGRLPGIAYTVAP